MRQHTILCDWCENEIVEHFVNYNVRHLGAYATWEGARYEFDFCDDDCLEEWKAHGRRCQRVDEQLARRPARQPDRKDKR